MKKLLLVSSVALAALGASASSMDGAYIGASLGDGFSSAAYRADITFSNGDQNSHENRLGGHGFDFGANAGWGKTFNDKVYLGFEGRAGYLSGSEERMESFDGRSGTTYKHGIKVTSGVYFGAGVRAGYQVLDNGMVYTRFGVDWQQYDTKIIHTGIFEKSTKRSTRAFFVPGIGFEWKHSENMSLNIEAEHAIGINDRQHHLDFNNRVVSAVSKCKSKYRKTTIRAGIRYKFNMPTM